MITLRVLRSPSILARKQSTKINQPTVCGLFLLYTPRSLTVGLYGDSSEMSYTTTLSYTNFLGGDFYKILVCMTVSLLI